MSNHADVLVIGGGPAAAKAVEELRSAGETGRVVVVGSEPHPPYYRPELSKGYLAGKTKAGGFDELDAGWYGEHDVELLTGRTAEAVEPSGAHVRLERGERIGYDRLLLATGSEPKPLPVPGAGLENVLSLRTVEHSDAIARAIQAGGPLVVVGGGWIGLEVASVARDAGLDVTLLESAATPLAAVLGEAVGAEFTALHSKHGVDVKTRVQVTELVDDGHGRVSGVRLSGGDLVPAAAVVFGVGISPRTDLAEAAGLAVDNGVLVDGRLRTSDPQIWAAGDVANAENAWAGRRLRVEHIANAEDQGKFVARSMLGDEARWAVPPFFWSDQYDAGLEYRGWTDPATSRLVLRGTPPDGTWFAFWLEGGRVAAGLHVNGWDDADTVKALVTEKAAVDPDRLADGAVPLAEARS